MTASESKSSANGWSLPVLSLPPPLGTVDYAVWAYTREMDRAEAERVRRASEHIEEEH